MHFVGMLAFSLRDLDGALVPIYYEPFLTVFSAFLAISFCCCGFWLVFRRKQTLGTYSRVDLPILFREIDQNRSPTASMRDPHILLCGVSVGIGISIMHYVGMSAMRMSADSVSSIFSFFGFILKQQWNLWLVGLSIVIGITAATAALTICFSLDSRIFQLPSSLLMGIGVCGMHYTAMGAVTYTSTNEPYPNHNRLIGIETLANLLAVLIISSCYIILGILSHRIKQSREFLKTLVEEKTLELFEEQERTEHLLYSMLPEKIANQLKSKTSEVPNEYFDCCTILFTDIVDFTTICSLLSADQVLYLLNDMYKEFDDLVQDYPIYKVETIGDSYMCVSGLPERCDSEHEHVRSICHLSLDLIEAVKLIGKRHPELKDLQIRVGIHSGSVVAGVVGSMMPRYCLFGDTVNVASRMESTSSPMKIQISDITFSHLSSSPLSKEFVLEERGSVEIKGKGLMKTHWLVGRNVPLTDVPNPFFLD